MIVTFRHKGLAELFEKGSSAKVNANHQPRCLRILDALAQATTPGDMNIPGLKFHSLHGFMPTRYAVSVSGAWRITFEFDGEDVSQVDLEQYH